MKRYHLFILLLIVLAGCSSNSSLSSFGSRKYTKGYFWDNPVKIEAKAQENSIKTEVKTKPEIEKKNDEEQSKQLAKQPLLVVGASQKVIQTNKKTALIYNSPESIKSIKSAGQPANTATNAQPKQHMLLFILGLLCWLASWVIVFLFVFGVGLALSFPLISFLLWIAALVLIYYSYYSFKPDSPVTAVFRSGLVSALFAILFFIALPRYISLNQKIEPGYFATPHIIQLLNVGYFLFIALFLAIKYLLKPGVKYKGFAIAVIAVSLILITLCFVLHYF